MDASGITRTRARPFRLNQSRASHLPSLSGDVAAPANKSDEKSGVAPDICNGASRCTTSDVSSSALTAASLASAAVLTVAASPYAFAILAAAARDAAASGSFHPCEVSATCARMAAGMSGAPAMPTVTAGGAAIGVVGAGAAVAAARRCAANVARDVAYVTRSREDNVPSARGSASNGTFHKRSSGTTTTRSRSRSLTATGSISTVAIGAVFFRHSAAS